jgi:hypothetical protein
MGTRASSANPFFGWLFLNFNLMAPTDGRT